jgi:glyoxylase-like metal-dependent hydrolase (beta-lactamase superfamily II)
MFSRVLSRLLLALCLVSAAPIVLSDEIPQTVAAASSFSLGTLELWSLRDSALIVPNDGSVFGQNANPAAVARVLSAAGAPTDKIALDVDVLMIRMPGHLVLLDAGWGSAGHAVLRQSLAAVGISPDQVTDILITHAHTDHVGGLVDEQGRPLFPKASIRMSMNEWAFMQSQEDTRTLAASIKSQVQPFEPGRPLLPGITPRALYGHTPGHVGYEIVSHGQKLLDIGDLAHSSIISLAQPDWTIDYDGNKLQGSQQRRAELQQLAATHELIFAPHFPFPGVGHIERSGDGFHFQPELPSTPQ